MPLLSYALTTLARQKSYLGISVSDHDALLKTLINAATQFIEDYLGGRRLKSTEYTEEKYDGSGTKRLVLRNFPVTVFTLLEKNTSSLNEDNWETVNAEDYWTELVSGIIKANFLFIKEPERYRVAYTAGFLIDFGNVTDSNNHTLPLQLEFACNELVGKMFNLRQSGGFREVTIGSLNVRMMKEALTSPQVKQVLDKFRAYDKQL